MTAHRSSTLEELLTHPEGKTLEFKRDLSSPRPLLKTLVAFANTAGGRLFVGIGDDRSIVGVENPLDEEERLCSLIADSIAPRLVPNVELLTVEGKTLLLIDVFVSGSRPHWLKSEGAESGVYVRLGSTSRQADAALIGELRRSVEGVAFDEMPMPDLSLKDLDMEAARQLFPGLNRQGEQALRTLKLVNPVSGSSCADQGRRTAVWQGTDAAFLRCLGSVRSFCRHGQGRNL